MKLLIALAVLQAASILKYGYKRIIALIILIIICKIFEFIIRKIRKDNIIYAPYWVLLSVTLVLPPSIPVYTIVTSTLFGLLITTVFFGGEGRDIISAVPLIWGIHMLSYPNIYNNGWIFPFSDLETVPLLIHPVNFIKETDLSVLDMFLGNYPSIPAATIPIVLLLLGIILMLLKVTDYKTALTYLLLTLVISFFSENTWVYIKTLMVGNFLITALIFLPLLRHSSKTKTGGYIIGVLAAILLYILNNFSTYLDGSMFVVLICSIFMPLIDDFILKIKVQGRKKYA